MGHRACVPALLELGAYLGLLHGETYVCADGATSVGTTEALKLEARITEKGRGYNRTF